MTQMQFKKLDRIIRNAFQLSQVKNPNSDLTPQEWDDAVFNLNNMLASWNNDGFRLFKIKDGYLPLIPGKKQYALATDAFKQLSQVLISNFQQIGATRINLDLVRNMSNGLRIVIENSTQTLDRTIKGFDSESGLVELNEPVLQPIVAPANVFYGDFNTASIDPLVMDVAFTQVPFNQTSIQPVVGDSMLIELDGVWAKVQIVTVSNTDITFQPQLAAGSITNSKLYFGNIIEHTVLNNSYPLKTRKINLKEPLSFAPEFVSLKSNNTIAGLMMVESIASDGMSLITFDGISEEVLLENGKQWLSADFNRISKTIIQVSDFTSFFQDITKCSIKDYVRNSNEEFCVIEGSDNNQINNRIFRRINNGNWQSINTTAPIYEPKLFTAGNNTYLAATNPSTVSGLFNITAGGFYPFGPQLLGGVKWVINHLDSTFLIGGDIYNDNTRDIVSTSDMATFSSIWKSVIPNADNAVSYLGKVFCGKTMTFVTQDFKSFSQIQVQADARCIVDSTLFNINFGEVCSYTDDGINFKQLPFVFSRSSSWAEKDGLSMVAMFNQPENNQPNLSQIFLTNNLDLSKSWNLQSVIPGLVHKIRTGDIAYLISDIEVQSMELVTDNLANEDVELYCFDQAIGRPQEVFNVVRYDDNNASQFPIEPKSLAEFSRLPQGHNEGEMVTYCFLREAEDAKFMVWGTPRQFGEYLKFSYVEPFALLLDTRQTPDFPDEYLGAVIEGLAYELAKQYGSPAEDTEKLRIASENSKQNCMLHDNEDTSYRIEPNIRR